MRRDGHGLPPVSRREFEFESVAAEQQAAFRVMEHRVPVEMAAGAVQDDARQRRQLIVEGPRHLQRRRPAEIGGGEGQLGVEGVL